MIPTAKLDEYIVIYLALAAVIVGLVMFFVFHSYPPDSQTSNEFDELAQQEAHWKKKKRDLDNWH